jgi:hypothetical protein
VTDLSSGATTLSPGTYTSGIRIRGTSVVTLNPGVYILQGGGTPYGFTVQDSAQVLMPASGGVLLYNTYSNYPGAAGGAPTCGQVNLNSTGAVTLRAQRAGSYAGIVVYQDRNCTASTRLQSSGARTLDGTIYLPNATLSATQSITLNLNAQPVVRQYSASRTVNLTFDPSKAAGGRAPALIE